MKNVPIVTYLTKGTISSELRMKNIMWKLKNEDEIDKPHKSQLKLEYNF